MDTDIRVINGPALREVKGRPPVNIYECSDGIWRDTMQLAEIWGYACRQSAWQRAKNHLRTLEACNHSETPEKWAMLGCMPRDYLLDGIRVGVFDGI